jgi:hypothetical protein
MDLGRIHESIKKEGIRSIIHLKLDKSAESLKPDINPCLIQSTVTSNLLPFSLCRQISLK